MSRRHCLLCALVAFGVVSALAAAPSGRPGISPNYASRHLLVRPAPGVSQSQVETVFSVLGVSLERSLSQIGVLVVRVPAGSFDWTLVALQRNPAVERVEQEVGFSALETRPNDVHWPGQWGLRRAGFSKAWDVARGSRATVVAVLDTGVERSHPDLRDAVLPGHDFVDDDSDPSDENGHGTAVAGILAARSNNKTGIAGACWDCRVLPVRVLARDGNGDSATLAAGIIWAVDHGADVINLSLGGEQKSMAEEGAIAYAVRHDVVLVAAAGNEGTRQRVYPAAAEHVIAVAATDQSGRLYPWSNRGDWIEIAAPGCNTSLWRGASYATFCGTSSSAPVVAGLAGLVRSAHPEATAAETKRFIGSGRLDAALAFSDPRSAATPTSSVRRQLFASIRRSARGR